MMQKIKNAYDTEKREYNKLYVFIINKAKYLKKTLIKMINFFYN